jgi:hypothetical protein
MNQISGSRMARLLWLGALALLVVFAVIPLSNRITRTGGMALGLVVWFGMIAFTWRYRFARFAFLAITAVCAGFLALPARSVLDRALLRDDYLRALRQYDGVRYYWGGECRTGIDCSGLIRRGLIDAMFLRGVRDLDAGLVRRSISLWWNDCTANALGEGYDELTTHVLDTTSLNELDHTKVLPGDLAVTSNGIHIMAYLGEQEWIEADPDVGRVIVARVPVAENYWFETRMRVMRWSVLAR